MKFCKFTLGDGTILKSTDDRDDYNSSCGGNYDGSIQDASNWSLWCHVFVIPVHSQPIGGTSILNFVLALKTAHIVVWCDHGFKTKRIITNSSTK